MMLRQPFRILRHAKKSTPWAVSSRQNARHRRPAQMNLVQAAYGKNKLVTPSSYGLNTTTTCPARVEHTPQCSDLHREIVRLDGSVWPSAHKRILGHQFAGPFQ